MDAYEQSLALVKRAEVEINDILLKSGFGGNFTLAYSREEDRHVVYFHPRGVERVVVGRFKLKAAWNEYFESCADHPALLFGATINNQYQKLGLATMVLTHYVKWLQDHTNQSGRKVEFVMSLLHLPTVLILFDQLPPKEKNISAEIFAVFQYLNTQIRNGTFKNLRDYGRTFENPKDIPATIRPVKKAQAEMLTRLICYLDSEDWKSLPAEERRTFLDTVKDTFFVKTVMRTGKEIHWEIKSGHMKDKNRLLLSFRLNPPIPPSIGFPRSTMRTKLGEGDTLIDSIKVLNDGKAIEVHFKPESGKPFLTLPLKKEGGFGKVYYANNSKILDVVKISITDEARRERSKRYIQHEEWISGLFHEKKLEGYANVTSGYAFEDGQRYAILMKGPNAEEFQSVRDRLNPVQCAKAMQMYAAKVLDAYRNGIVLHDLQPSNVLLVLDEAGDPQRVEVIDNAGAKILRKEDAYDGYSDTEFSVDGKTYRMNVRDRRFQVPETTVQLYAQAVNDGKISRENHLGLICLLELVITFYNFVLGDDTNSASEAAAEAFVNSFAPSARRRVIGIISNINNLERFRNRDDVAAQLVLENSSLIKDPNLVQKMLVEFECWLHELSQLDLSGYPKRIKKKVPTDTNIIEQLGIKKYMNFSELTVAVGTAVKLGVKFPEGAYVQAENFPVRDFVALALEDAINKVSATTVPDQRTVAIMEFLAAREQVIKLYEGLGRQPDNLAIRYLDAYSSPSLSSCPI